jgi:hypothetical protein
VIDVHTDDRREIKLTNGYKQIIIVIFIEKHKNRLKKYNYKLINMKIVLKIVKIITLIITLLSNTVIFILLVTIIYEIQ